MKTILLRPILLIFIFNFSFQLTAQNRNLEITFKKSETHFLKKLNNVWNVDDAKLTLKTDEKDRAFIHIHISSAGSFTDEYYEYCVEKTNELFRRLLSNYRSFNGSFLYHHNTTNQKIVSRTIFHYPDVYPLLKGCKPTEIPEDSFDCFQESIERFTIDLYDDLRRNNKVAWREMFKSKKMFVVFAIDESGKVEIEKFITENRKGHTLPNLKLFLYKKLQELPIIAPAKIDGKYKKIKFTLPLAHNFTVRRQ